MSLTDFRTLGRSGLVVSPLTLGIMTFGTPRWGSSADVSEAVFDAYVAAGGNFIDTADVYAGGRSEELLGGFVAQRGLRDQLVLATKFGFNAQPGNPHAGGNGRKNIHRALDNSLRRLQTDYVDLYWLHVWDTVTPVEEVLQTLGDLVRAGCIHYFAFSDMPAWYVTRAATLAQAHGVPGPVAMQLEYSLVARDVEREHIAAARECGLGLLAVIRSEYERPIDAFSQDVLVAQLEVLLNYANRFYHRQFLTRRTAEHDLLSRFKRALAAYFVPDGEQPLPTVQYFANALHVSPAYLGDMLRALTGESTQQHLHRALIENANRLLLSTFLTINETAFRLGFEYPQYFTRLFKSKTGLTPAAFRFSVH